MIEFIKKISSYIVWSDYINMLASEFTKIVIAGIFGFLTFKIYQGYKNKKDNHQLYILLIKLEREIENKTQVLKDVLVNSNRLELLKEKFLIKKDPDLANIYRDISGFSDYICEYPIVEHGELVNIAYIYCDTPDFQINLIDQHISSLRYDKNTVGNEEHISDLECQLAHLESKSLIKELEVLEKRLKDCSKSNSHSLSFEYLLEKVSIFNRKTLKVRKENLDDFCSSLLDKDNIFSSLLKEYREMVSLGRTLDIYNKTKSISIIFDEWKNSENKTLIAQFSVDSYIKLDKLYSSLNEVSIRPWDVGACRNLLSTEIRFVINEINTIKGALEKTIKRTAFLFKNL